MASLPACCMDLDIDVMDFLFPDRLNPEGREFVDAHWPEGVAWMDTVQLLRAGQYMGAGIVKLKHRCAQLQDDGRCGIYATRPAICRAFDCATRHDCACQGAGELAQSGVVVWHD